MLDSSDVPSRCASFSISKLWYELVKSDNYFCRAMKTKGMMFRYTWVYSKEDTMAHTHRAVVAS